MNFNVQVHRRKHTTEESKRPEVKKRLFNLSMERDRVNQIIKSSNQMKTIDINHMQRVLIKQIN